MRLLRELTEETSTAIRHGARATCGSLSALMVRLRTGDTSGIVLFTAMHVNFNKQSIQKHINGILCFSMLSPQNPLFHPAAYLSSGQHASGA